MSLNIYCDEIVCLEVRTGIQVCIGTFGYGFIVCVLYKGVWLRGKLGVKIQFLFSFLSFVLFSLGLYFLEEWLKGIFC